MCLCHYFTSNSYMHELFINKCFHNPSIGQADNHQHSRSEMCVIIFVHRYCERGLPYQIIWKMLMGLQV